MKNILHFWNRPIQFSSISEALASSGWWFCRILPLKFDIFQLSFRQVPRSSVPRQAVKVTDKMCELNRACHQLTPFVAVSEKLSLRMSLTRLNALDVSLNCCKNLVFNLTRFLIAFSTHLEQKSTHVCEFTEESQWFEMWLEYGSGLPRMLSAPDDLQREF